MKKYFILFTVLFVNLSQFALASDFEADIATIQEVAIMKTNVPITNPTVSNPPTVDKRVIIESIAQAQLIEKVEAGIGSLNKQLEAKGLSALSAKLFASKGADRVKAVAEINGAWSQYQSVVASSLGITNAARGTELSQSLLKVKLQMLAQVLHDQKGKLLSYTQIEAIAVESLSNIDSQPSKESAAKKKSVSQIVSEVSSFIKSNNADGTWSEADVTALAGIPAAIEMKAKAKF